MQGVDQVNAFIIRDAAHEICAMENDIAGVVLHSRGAQQQFQWHASPFANSAPTFDTVMAGDLATQRHLPDLSHGEGERAIDQPSDPQPIISELPFGERSVFRGAGVACPVGAGIRSEEHTSEIQAIMRTSYADFGLKKKR